MKAMQILDIVRRIRNWAETGEVKNLPAATDLIEACNEIIKMIERDIDDLK